MNCNGLRGNGDDRDQELIKRTVNFTGPIDHTRRVPLLAKCLLLKSATTFKRVCRKGYGAGDVFCNTIVLCAIGDSSFAQVVLRASVMCETAGYGC